EPRRVHRNRETDSLRTGDDGRVDSHDLAAGIDERTAGVARIERRIRLDHAVNQTPRLRAHRSPERAHDARRYSRRESEWIADRDDDLPRSQPRRIAERRGDER